MKIERLASMDQPTGAKDAPQTNARFAAIDFETADQGRDSACALSVVLVSGNTIEKSVYHLIRPPRRQMIFEYIHGISWNAVSSKPVFAELWPRISGLFDEIDFIAAHNSSFDKSVLKASCTQAGFAPPEKPFLCTVRLARKIWNIYPTRLPDVCRKLGIGLTHHDAASDAMACAQIVVAAYTTGYSYSERH